MAERSAKVIYWIKTLSKFVSVQLIVQGLGFASGILLIRSLDKQEYAYFTLANSMQGAMSVLANSGVTSALSAIGGKVWQDSHRFGQLINTAMQWRRYLAAISITVVTPILLWMLIQNGASIRYTILLTVGILLELHFYLSEGVLRIVPRLHSQIGRLQRLDLLFAVSRLVLLLGSYLTLLNAAVGVFASTIATGLRNILLWHWVKDTVDTKAPINQDDQIEIIKLVKIQTPYTIFYCVQGQLTIWLISILGNTQNIAEIGALSRLGGIFSIIASVMVNVVMPSFSRCQSPRLLIKRYSKIICIYGFLSVFLVSFAVLYPKQLLWILGDQYANLKSEVALIVVSCITHSFVSSLWLVNVSKGWIKQSWIFIPIIIFTQFVLVTKLDLSSVRGVIWFGILPTLPSACINFYMTCKGLHELKKV